jgi:radical SAM protein with 4Fe4S-binding SPASM domain
LGNISNSNIRDMIIAGDFDEYWELTKDKIDTCKDCEYRWGCTDCRVLALKEAGSTSAKHPSCHYNPYFEQDI